MLRRLSIRDVVLIDRLDVEFDTGLCVLTGETGAGKSILLDSLGLALGARADASVVRRGAAQASVAAAFELPPEHSASRILAEQGLDADEVELVLRRVLNSDGRSRAFINDQPVSVGLLREVGEGLVEVHGQFEHRGLLAPATHLAALDAFGDHSSLLAAVRETHASLAQANARLERAESELAQARAEESFLRHAFDELDALAPLEGEESRLAVQRRRLQHAEKLLEVLDRVADTLGGESGAEQIVQRATGELARVAELAAGRLDTSIAALDRAGAELSEALHELRSEAHHIDLDRGELDRLETRLFALRAAARKHGVEPGALPEVRRRLAERLEALDDQGGRLTELAQAAERARRDYEAAARRLSAARKKAGKNLDKAVASELPPLKLEKSRFTTEIGSLVEDAWGPNGMDRVRFQVVTNQGAAPGPIDKIASGGELSRFLLALKVVLARDTATPTLVFDEVDAGVGGATAAAVGERLARLATDRQILVVSHSPQVAAAGAHHWRVVKHQGETAVMTEVSPLASDARREEIARMLSGAVITDEARAAAERLLAGH
ncbi:MAG: DNA repair protein RecN [Alphaproteobacteria bacterium]